MPAPAPSPVLLGVSLKMYFGHHQTLNWSRRIAALAERHPAVTSGAARLFVLPTFPALVPATGILAPYGVALGAQDIATEDSGPYTGEVGGPVLKEIGCRYAEVGHAERRRLYGEGDTVVAAKTAAALRNGLTPSCASANATRRTRPAPPPARSPRPSGCSAAFRVRSSSPTSRSGRSAPPNPPPPITSPPSAPPCAAGSTPTPGTPVPPSSTAAARAPDC